MNDKAYQAGRASVDGRTAPVLPSVYPLEPDSAPRWLLGQAVSSRGSGTRMAGVPGIGAGGRTTSPGGGTKNRERSRRSSQSPLGIVTSTVMRLFMRSTLSFTFSPD